MKITNPFLCVFIGTITTLSSMQIQAVQAFTVVCGDGKEIQVADSIYSPGIAALLCLRANHPAPKQTNAIQNLSASAGEQPTMSSPSRHSPARKKTWRAHASSSQCGSDVSISVALDQCGKKGFTTALCKKKDGNWSCLPSEDENHPEARPTGLRINH